MICKIRCAIVAIVLLVLLPQMAAASGNRAEQAPVSSSLLQSLQQGGYILYVRHGEANEGEDQPNLTFRDCSTQRNLSQAGKEEAIAYGETLRRLHIPVLAPVLASPFCRTRETAELAFGQEKVQVDPFWISIYRLSGDVPLEEQATTLSALTYFLEKIPKKGSNQVIIAHSFPKGIGLGEISNLGSVVVKPKGIGKGYEIIDRISLQELSSIR
ncbi:histidine phosphatase family protein [Paenibacillus sp. R14(2021)]|uniref:histidine phosphatase family protein n=1 Tax=Paenibacillus sp. R14(2021) TaxID=2859228 RepID=UPI001C614E32|nr:histidine phosphatase family protein [Paenibacillus sp. R14(2021)]